MKRGDNLQLLIIEESKNDAESLANALRSEGHRIQFSHGSTMAAIETALNDQHPDIVLCGSGAAIPSYGEITPLLGKHGLTAAVIAIADEAPEAEVVAAQKYGISSLISYQQPDHLLLAFNREVAVLRLQQKLDAIKDAHVGSEARCHALIENSSDAVAYIHDGMHVYANRPYMDLFAIQSREEIEGTPVLDMVSEAHRDTFKGFLKGYFEKHAQGDSLDIDCLNPGGEVFQCSMELSPATMEGEPCTQIIIRVNASNAELEKKIETLSRLDALTGLTNRQHFMKLLEERIGEQDTASDHRALIYITLDKFKVIREEFGIAASDTLLCNIARLLEEHCGEQDCLSRFGDYSFTILHHDSSEEKTRALGETLLHKIAAHTLEVNGRAINTTGSIGCCAINNKSDNAQIIISHADMACEIARSSDGNRIYHHNAVVTEQMEQEVVPEVDDIIRKIIDEERLSLAFQPIVSLKKDTRQRYEVLLRFIDEAGQTILPGQFLSTAGKTGRCEEIDHWIITTALRALTELIKHDSDAIFYINLAAPTLTDSGLPAWIEEQLRINSLGSDAVVFEISEHTAIDDLKNTMAFVKSMQNLSFRIAFDHYGHHDQPQLLQHIPVDILKIDGALISGLPGNKENQSRVKAIIELAKEHGKETVAECVDNAVSLAQLWQYGVDFVQGDFVQQPCESIEYDFEDGIT